MENITYKERPKARKPDNNCKQLTLLVRKYYHNKADYYQRNKDEMKRKARERYANDKKNKESNELKMKMYKNNESIDIM